jgi:hypothetical protein
VAAAGFLVFIIVLAILKAGSSSAGLIDWCRTPIAGHDWCRIRAGFKTFVFTVGQLRLCWKVKTVRSQGGQAVFHFCIEITYLEVPCMYLWVLYFGPKTIFLHRRKINFPLCPRYDKSCSSFTRFLYTLFSRY